MSPLVESEHEYRLRRAAAMLGPDDVDTSWSITGREAEAVGVFLWGDMLPFMQTLWEMEEYGLIRSGMLEKGPTNSQIGRWMQPTRSGEIVGGGNASQFLRRAARKFWTTKDGLRVLAARGLESKARAKAWVEELRGREAG